MELPNVYKGKQLLLASKRVVIIGHKSDIFLNSKKTISLSANKSVNVDTTGHFIVNAKTIYLGVESINKSQPMVRGNDLIDILSKLVNGLDELISLTEKTPGDIPASIVLGFSYIKGSIQSIKETYGKDLKKALSTKTYVA